MCTIPKRNSLFLSSPFLFFFLSLSFVAAFLTQTVALEDATVKFEIWDTAGQERYRSLAPMYYRGAAAAIVVYDITDPDSFAGAKSWVKELQRRGDPNVIIALAGNKADLEGRFIHLYIYIVYRNPSIVDHSSIILSCIIHRHSIHVYFIKNSKKKDSTGRSRAICSRKWNFTFAHKCKRWIECQEFIRRDCEKIAQGSSSFGTRKLPNGSTAEYW